MAGGVYFFFQKDHLSVEQNVRDEERRRKKRPFLPFRAGAESLLRCGGASRRLWKNDAAMTHR